MFSAPAATGLRALATGRWRLLESFTRDFNSPAAWAGVTTFIWYAVGLVPVQIAITGQFGLNASQVSSWIFIIWFTGAVSSIVLSLKYRQPIPITSSIPGLIFLGTLSAHFSFAELMGANLMAGVLITALGVFGIGGRLLAWLPMPLAMGMLGGSILGDVTRVVASTSEDVVVAGSTVVGYFVGRALRHPRIPPVSLALLLGGLAVFLTHRAAPTPVVWTLPTLVMPGLEFSLVAFVAVSLPLVVLSMGLGNVQGLGFLLGQGYRVPVNQTTVVLGINSIVNALFGGHVAIVSRNGMPIMAGPEAGPVGGRYWANVISAGLCLLIALAAGPVASLLGVLPRGYVVALAGLAILPSFQNALEKAVGGGLRSGAVIAFVVAATPFSFLGITSAFWALLAGLAASAIAERAELLLHWRGGSADEERRQSERVQAVLVPTSARRIIGSRRTPLDVSIRNISASGLKVRCTQRVLPGQQLEFFFALPDGHAEVRLRVDVRHVELLQNELVEMWEAGCEFREMSTGAHEQLLTYLLEQQQVAVRLTADGTRSSSRPPWASRSVTVTPEFIGSR
jgi:benzoate membrane transport protein